MLNSNLGSFASVVCVLKPVACIPQQVLGPLELASLALGDGPEGEEGFRFGCAPGPCSTRALVSVPMVSRKGFGTLPLVFLVAHQA